MSHLYDCLFWCSSAFRTPGPVVAHATTGAAASCFQPTVYHSRTDCPHRVTSAARTLSAQTISSTRLSELRVRPKNRSHRYGYQRLQISQQHDDLCLLYFSFRIYPFRFLHLGCIGAIGAGSYRRFPVSLRRRHLEQHFGDILDLFFLPELRCSVVKTLVVFSLSPLFSSVHSRSYDSTFDLNLHTPFTRSALSVSGQKGV